MMLDNLHVAPSVRGRGIGSQLLAAVLSRADRRGASRLCLWVFATNHGARRFYQREGGMEGLRRTEVFDEATRVEEVQVRWDLTV